MRNDRWYLVLAVLLGAGLILVSTLSATPNRQMGVSECQSQCLDAEAVVISHNTCGCIYYLDTYNEPEVHYMIEPN